MGACQNMREGGVVSEKSLRQNLWARDVGRGKGNESSSRPPQNGAIISH